MSLPSRGPGYLEYGWKYNRRTQNMVNYYTGCQSVVTWCEDLGEVTYRKHNHAQPHRECGQEVGICKVSMQHIELRVLPSHFRYVPAKQEETRLSQIPQRSGRNGIMRCRVDVRSLAINLATPPPNKPCSPFPSLLTQTQPSE